MDMDHDTGVFTGKIIRLISDIRAKHGQNGKDSVNLKNCGKFTLAEDLSDISDMTSIDMSSIYSLEGRCCLEECSFLRLRTSAPFFGGIFFSENLARIFSSGSQNLEKIPGIFFAPFKLPRSLTLALPACQPNFTQATSKCSEIASS